MTPRRIPRAEHPVSRSQISSGTLKTLYALRDAGYEAYMVGGGVRDLLAGVTPKDFDVATSAHPDQVKALFRSCRLVGRRFVICHVRQGGEIVEVTTFRGPVTDSHERDDTGRILSDNAYGTLEEDAFRRDFTVNALYYDIRDYAIVDFAGGMEDLRNGVLRLIGDPELRYREDPVRMLRAIRIVNKLRFRLDPATAAPIGRLGPLLREIPPARLFDELLKMLLSREAVDNLYGLRVYGLYRQLLPASERVLQADPSQLRFVNAALANTAERIGQELPVSPAFLFAALLWPVVQQRLQFLVQTQGHPPLVALNQASEEVIAQAISRVAIPKRFSLPMREIWQMQPRFEELRSGARARRLLTHPRFRAAYDFLLMRAVADPDLQPLASWWTQAQSDAELPPLPALAGSRLFSAEAGEPGEMPEAAEAGEGTAPGRRRRRRRGGRGRREGGAAEAIVQTQDGGSD
ncbi:MAG TPA: polynucleotide adenylyltransferase PcnB [Nevskiaceae bacterium]|nr:polynucleotide adenylyltransferase PcnB [Nevskiaceae bacterium]